jgi:hypothetical protein
VLNVAGAANLYDALHLEGAAELKGALGVSGAASFSNAVAIAGAARMASSLDVAMAASFSNVLNVAGAANLYDALHLEGAAELKGALGVSGAASFSNAVAIAGAARMASSIDVALAASFSNVLNVAGAAHLYDALHLEGAAELKGALGVSGAASFSNAVAIAGAARMASSLDVAMAASFSNVLNVAGAANLYDALTVEKLVELKDKLNVVGEVSLSSNLFLGSNAGIDSKVAGGIINIGSSKCSEINIGASDLTQVISLGCGSGATIINIGAPGGNDTVNIAGNLTYVSSSTLQIQDKNVVVNRDGTAATGAGAGLSVEEAGVNTGYLQISGTRAAWSVKAPATEGVVSITPGAAGFTLDQGSHDPASIGAASNGLSIANQVISLGNASASAPGALSVVDWSAFNSASSKVNGAAVSQIEIGYLVGVSSGIQAQFSNASADLVALSNAEAAALSNAVSAQQSAQVSYSNAVVSRFGAESNAGAAALSNAVAAQQSAQVSYSNAVLVQFGAESNAGAAALSNAVAAQTASLLAYSNADVAAQAAYVAAVSAQFTSSNISASNLSVRNISVTGNILPTSNVTYDLGSSNMRFRDLWLSGSTLYLADTSLSMNSSGGVDIGSNVFAQNVLGVYGSFSSNVNSHTINATTISAASFVGQITTASQPNLTSLGTLTGLNMNGSLIMTNNSIIDGPANGSLNFGINTSNINIGSSTIAQRISIGKGFNTSVIDIGGNSDDIINLNGSVNLIGGLTSVKTTILDVVDKNITINKNGAQYSGFGAGISVEENGAVAGYAQVSGDALRTAWEFKAPGSAGVVLITPGTSGFTINQGSHDAITLGSGSNGLALSNQVLSIGLASASAPGALSAADWSVFNAKQPALTGAATSIASANLSVFSALVSDANGKVAASGVSAVELGYLSGVSSGIQTQLGAHTSSIASLSNATASNFTSTNASIVSLSNASAASLSNLSATVSANKSSADTSFTSTNASIVSLSNASAASLSNLTSTVTANKSSADTSFTSTNASIVSLSNASAASLSNLTSTVTANKSSADASFTSTNASIVSLSNAHVALSNDHVYLKSACSNVVLTVASQPNVTSLGTLSSLVIQNNLNLLSGALQLNGSNALVMSSSNLVFGSNLMQLESNGRLTLVSDLNAYGTITSASDIRLKHDIAPIEDALNKVDQLRGVCFTMNDSGKRSTGLIAQDVAKVLSEAVLPMENGYMSVAYGNIVGLLVEAIKELRAEVQALKK